MSLEKFIYHFNLSTTLNVKDVRELCCKVNSGVIETLDLSNSISFYHLVDSFNKLNNLFRKDYSNLKSLNVGEKVELIRYSGYDDFKCLTIYVEGVNKDIVDDYDTIMYIVEDKGKVYSVVTNNINPLDENFYRKEVRLDENLMREYLVFGEKYSLFFDSYNKLKNEFIFGNGTTVLFSKINGEFPSFNEFELAFGNHFFNGEDYINVLFKLGDKLEIDYDKSEVKLFTVDYDEENKKEVIDSLVNSLYINKEKVKMKRK